MIDKWVPCYLAPVLCVAVFVGCGGSDEGPETFAVSGTVKFNGEPITAGDVVFRPADGEGQSWAGKIEDGQFTLDSTAGEKKIEITAFREAPTPSQFSDSGEGASQVQFVPAEYNKETTLKETVSDSGDNDFTFDLKGE